MNKKILYQNTPPACSEATWQQVDVWQFPLHHQPDWAQACLSEDELARADRFHFAKHRQRFTVARAGMRLILAQYLATSPDKLSFTTNHHGKPALTTANLGFNLSHSGELAMLAISKHPEIGVDIEYFSPRSFLGIANHCFSDKEIQALITLPASSRMLGFFKIWSQKEAFIKAVGMGLAYPLKEFDVLVQPSADYAITDSLTGTCWHIHSFMPQAACCAALCIPPMITDIRKIELTDLHQLDNYL